MLNIEKQQLLVLLAQQCEEYAAIPASEQMLKREKKSFINGLMTACRVIGISYEELDFIVTSMAAKPQYKNLDEKLAIPTYLRNKLDLGSDKPLGER